MSEENQNQNQDQGQSKLAEELQVIKQQLAEANKKAEESKNFVDAVQKVVTGDQAHKPKAPNEVFMDDLITKGPAPVQSLVRQELQREAYFNSLRSSFQQKNPHLEPFKEEVFGMADALVQNAAAQGKNISHEAALETATGHYNEKHKRTLSIAGANASPGGYAGMPNSRYEGSGVDYFAMDDKEFKQVMDQRDNERKKRSRDGLAHYGYGR